MAQKIKKIRTRYDFVVGVSKAGNGKNIKTYAYEYNDENLKVLVVKGVDSLYEKIQLHKDDTDIYKILDKYFRGDLSVLDKNKGIYCDVSQLPDNIVDLNNRMLEQQELFAKLPIDIKKLYGNSLGKFSKAINDSTFIDDIVSNKELYEKYLKKNEILREKEKQIISDLKDNGKEVQDGKKEE